MAEPVPRGRRDRAGLCPYPMYCSGWLWWMTILHVGQVLFSSRYFTRQLRQTARKHTPSESSTRSRCHSHQAARPRVRQRAPLRSPRRRPPTAQPTASLDRLGVWRQGDEEVRGRQGAGRRVLTTGPAAKILTSQPNRPETVFVHQSDQIQ